MITMAERTIGPREGDAVEVKLAGRVIGRDGDQVSVTLYRDGGPWLDVTVPVHDVVILGRSDPGGL